MYKNRKEWLLLWAKSGIINIQSHRNDYFEDRIQLFVPNQLGAHLCGTRKETFTFIAQSGAGIFKL